MLVKVNKDGKRNGISEKLKLFIYTHKNTCVRLIRSRNDRSHAHTHTTECYETDSARYSNPADDVHSLFPVNKLMAA